MVRSVNSNTNGWVLDYGKNKLKAYKCQNKRTSIRSDRITFDEMHSNKPNVRIDRPIRCSFAREFETHATAIKNYDYYYTCEDSCNKSISNKWHLYIEFHGILVNVKSNDNKITYERVCNKEIWWKKIVEVYNRVVWLKYVTQ